MKNPLLDQEFLEKLFLYRHKEIFAKIILLSFDELPVKEIQGKITAGSVNVDGDSTVRHTCSLTMVTPESYITDAHWGLRNKFKLEVGVRNFIDSSYPDFIWFKQGMFVITSLNESFAVNSHSIAIQGKDKMCLLNGEVGGNLIASTDFGKIDIYEKDKDGKNVLTYDYLKIKDIIKYAVGTFGMELPQNIIINDVDDYGKELLEYRGEKPLYLYKDIESNEITQMFFESESGIDDYAATILKNIEEWSIDEETDKVILKLNSEFNLNDLIVKRDFKVREEDIDYQAEINKYTETDAKWALYTYLHQHKIAKMESDNYDDNGNFIFDVAIPELTVEKQAPTVIIIGQDSAKYEYSYDRSQALNTNEGYTITKIEYGQTAGYRQTDLTYPGDLIANIGETLTSVLDKIKSTFGDYEYFYDLDGRFVFQAKKTYINNSWNNLVEDKENDVVYANSAAYSSAVTWRFENNMLLTAFSNNPNIQNLKNDFGVWGERESTNGAKLPVHIRYAIQDKPQYYFSNYEKKAFISKEVDDEGVDWRELIYQMAIDYYKNNKETDSIQDIILQGGRNKEYYPQGITGYEMFYIDMQGFWRQLYNPEAIGQDGEWVQLTAPGEVSQRTYSTDTGWNRDVTERPENLNFWFDFMSADSELGKYSISIIGDRTKVVNNNKVTAIYFKETPTILFSFNNNKNIISELKMNNPGYTIMSVPSAYAQYFTISAQGQSAQSALTALLNEHTFTIDSTTITSIPIYHLQPNTRIFVKDDNTKVNGEYIVSKLTIPLTYNGTMSITATKAVENIY